ncbi:MAG: protein kinase [Proteobacteria bacterium]|nr:protein kinase [Pseudomonadota bacterium]
MVFLARDVRLGRRVAIKFLAEDNDSLPERFRAEARATARCKHENIVIVHDVGEALGRSYIVLEYVEGTTLREWINDHWELDDWAGHDFAPADISTSVRSAVSADLAVEIIVPVVRALAHAHGRGLVHRDLKPENIMLSRDGTIKVLDFGIAKLLDPTAYPYTTGQSHERSDGRAESRASAIVGTLPYMSPEQWTNDGVDARSDIWAVGIILWELLTGHHPLAPLSATRLMEVATLILSMPSISLQRPDIGPLADVIDGCLHKHKADRISSTTALLEQLEGLARRRSGAASTETTEDVANPYAGLAAFQEADAERFFGRDREIASMMTRLRLHRLIAVVGPSGAGKSSFIRAGVIPALKRSGRAWEAFIVRPGREPLAALANVLATIASPRNDRPGMAGSAHSDADRQQAQIANLRAQPGTMGAVLRGRCRERRARILFFVDQFEELYTLGADGETRAAFLRSLDSVADDVSCPLRVVLSLRSDFLDRVTEDRAFSSELTQGLLLLPPMGREELRQTLTLPLEATGCRFETDETVETALDALELTRSPLPLLQFTAAQLWQARDREHQLLTQESYDALGGVAGALAGHADEVLSGISGADQRLARLVLTNLVTEERTRAVVSVSELCALAPETMGDALKHVVQNLARARLLHIENDAARGAMVELSHESLIERWPRLRQWLDEDEEEARFRARLRTAATEWDKRGQTEELLWRGPLADESKRWQAHWRRLADDQSSTGSPGTWVELGERDRQYLQAVMALAARVRRRRRQLAVAAFAMISAVAVVVSVLAVRANRAATDAQEQAIQARNANRMSVARENQLDPTLVLALVRELEPFQQPERWRELARWAMQQGIARVVLEHPDEVWQAAFSPDGTRIVTVSLDKTARVWNADGSGQPVVLRGHQEVIWSAAFSPDGTHIVTASSDKTARVWRSDGGGQPLILRGHSHNVLRAAFSPDGTHIVTASADKTGRVWRADGTGQSVVLRGHLDTVWQAAFSPDSTHIVTASVDKTARVWRADGTGQSVVLRGHLEPVATAAFSPDGGRVFTASLDKTARVWRADGSGQPVVLRGPPVAFSPDGTRILTASSDKTARVWRADGSGQPVVLRGHQGSVGPAAFSPDGTRVLTASSDKTARVWRADGSGKPVVLRGHLHYIRSATFSPDGTRVLTASLDRTARVWSVDSSIQPVVLGAHLSSVQTAVFSPDGTRVLTSSRDNITQVWRADGSGRPVLLRGHLDYLSSAVFSPDGIHIVTASYDKTVRLHNADGSGPSRVLREDIEGAHPMVLSPDGSRIAIISADEKSLRVWNANGSGQPVILRGHLERVSFAAFSPDSARVVTASEDKTARVWNANGSGQPVVLRGHLGSVASATFSPNSTRIVTASADKTARVWNADGSGQPVVLRGHLERVYRATLSPDGAHILTVSEDKTGRVWRVDGSGQPVVLRGHLDYIVEAAFSPNGTRVVTIANDQTIRLWSVDNSREPLILRAPDLNATEAAFSPDGSRIVTASHAVRMPATSQQAERIEHAAKVWSNLEPIDGLDDPLLWTATTYCPSVKRRMRLLSISEELAIKERERCLRRVAATQEAKEP